MAASRERWSSKFIFIVAAIGSAIGLGNIWRFPYLVGKYGGGAFLVPYFITLIFIGIPLLILEFAIGQKMQCGSVKAFRKINRRCIGIGLAPVLSGFVVCCYYSVVMGWCVLYSFYATKLAWGDNPKQFFFEKVLHISAGADQMGHIVPAILLALIASWFMIYFSVWKGVESLSKVVMWAMPLPLILLVLLVLRGASLPGASLGIHYYLHPNFQALKNIEVWTAALSQIFFTLTLGFGAMIAYASYEDVNSDIAQSAVITAIVNSFLSVLAGFAVFCTLGHMSYQSGVPVSELAAAGPSLTFIAFPKALNLIPGAKLFAVLFFIMLLSLAIDSAFSLVEALATVLSDFYRNVRRQDIVLYICVVGFLGGLIFTTYAGLYYLDIVDHFTTNYGLVAAGLAQCVVVGWVYGAGRMRRYINKVSRIKLGYWWEISIRYVIPLSLSALIGHSLYQDLSQSYGHYASWALALFGWSIPLMIFSISFIVSALQKPSRTH